MLLVSVVVSMGIIKRRYFQSDLCIFGFTVYHESLLFWMTLRKC